MLNFSNQRGFVPFLILALVVGLIVVGGGFYLWQQSNVNSIPTLPQPTSQPNLTLSLQNPSDGTVVVNNNLTVSGKTLPKTTVVFYTEDDQASVDSDEQGNFAGTIKLEGGINTLVVTAFGDDGSEKTITENIVFDSQT